MTSFENKPTALLNRICVFSVTELSDSGPIVS